MTVFKKGDRVRFTGNHSPLFHASPRVGKLGTVREIVPNRFLGEDTVSVEWDGQHGYTVNHYRTNLEKVEPAPKIDAAKAVADLRKTADDADRQADALTEVAEAARDLADALEKALTLGV